MAKRFTDSEKWTDKWFRKLPPDQKLAYLYILDRCDMAGTVEIDEELAEFQMGCPTDWEGLVKGSEGRLVPLGNGRIWVVKFIAFQHGKLSESCNAHRSAIQLIERYQLPIPLENKEKQSKGSGRVQEPLGKGPGNSNSNSNSKKKGGVGENISECNSTGDDSGVGGNTLLRSRECTVSHENQQAGRKGQESARVRQNRNLAIGEWLIPARMDTPRIRSLLDDFAKMRRQIGHPIKNLSNTSRILDKFDDEPHLAHAIEFCIANEYQGLKTDYRPPLKQPDLFVDDFKPQSKPTRTQGYMPPVKAGAE